MENHPITLGFGEGGEDGGSVPENGYLASGNAFPTTAQIQSALQRPVYSDPLWSPFPGIYTPAAAEHLETNQPPAAEANDQQMREERQTAADIISSADSAAKQLINDKKKKRKKEADKRYYEKKKEIVNKLREENESLGEQYNLQIQKLEALKKERNGYKVEAVTERKMRKHLESQLKKREDENEKLNKKIEDKNERIRQLSDDLEKERADHKVTSSKYVLLLEKSNHFATQSGFEQPSSMTNLPSERNIGNSERD